MRRKALYSRAARRRVRPPQQDGEAWFDSSDPFVQETPLGALAWQAVRRFALRHDRGVMVAGTLLIAIALFGFYNLFDPSPRPLAQWDIDNAVKYTLANTPRGAAETAAAAATIAPSVVRVDGFLSPEHAAQLATMEQKEATKDRSLHRLPARPGGKPDAKSDTGKKGEADPDSTGSGVVIDQKGDILTNLHVINSTDHWV
ncbi:MAG TPA: hypothetical protein VHV26_02940, partial [Rhizomicrobium sp.]|nr:hypothetical protein [Rhizomicrobium sp.]